MEQIELVASERQGKPNALRAKGIIPAVVYGKGMESISLQIDEKAFKKVIGGQAGSNAIITLKIGSTSALPVITHDIQKDALTRKYLHIDFYRIKMDEAIKTKVHLIFTGISTGVKEDAGILVTMLNEVEIKCLPGNIPEKIEIEISKLKINDSIYVSDLPAMSGVEYITPAKELIITVAPPAKEEVVEAAPVAAEVAAVPGAAPAAGAAAPVADAKAAPAAAAAPAAKAKAKA